MTELEYIFHRICDRRGVDLKKVESVALAMRCNFGLANLTALIPAVANTFYWGSIFQNTIVQQGTAGVLLRFTNYGGGSAGDADYLSGTNITHQINIQDIEFDSMVYVVNGNTSGVITIFGTVFKITTG